MQNKLSIGLPIWYGAKVKEIERCIDSIYSSIEKINPQHKNHEIEVIIGIDNIPKNYIPTIKKPDNTKEILERITIFKDALANLGSNYSLNYFITEHNSRVSVMRNIMISKAQNSRFITFIDHDDTLKLDAFNTIFETDFDDDIKFVYFQGSCEGRTTKFEGLAPWAVLYDTKFLLENQISFVPGIPMEDRFFRREIELYALEEEQINIEKSFYIHNKEQASGWLENNVVEITRQELYKRCCYKCIKPKNYITIKRGFKEIYYSDIIMKFNDYKPKEDARERFFYLCYKDQHVIKEELENLEFFDGKKINSYDKENHFTLIKVKSNNNTNEIFCRGLLTDGSIDLGQNSIENVNKIVESLGIYSFDFIKLLSYLTPENANSKNIIKELTKIRENKILQAEKKSLEKILKEDSEIDLSFIKPNEVLQRYIFNQSYTFVINEQKEKLKNNIKNYPEILVMQNDKGITLANIACRRQTLHDFFVGNAKSSFLDNKNKFISLLFKASPESFKLKDKYGRSGFSILLQEYNDDLKMTNPIDDESLNKFTKIMLKLLSAFGEDDYKLIPLFRIVYKELRERKNQDLYNIIIETSNKKELSQEEKTNFIQKTTKDLMDVLNKDIVIDNLIEALANKEYSKIEGILLEKKMNTNKFLGSQREQDILEITFSKYMKFTTLIELLEKVNLLELTKNDLKFKEIIKRFLIESIYYTLYNPLMKEIVSMDLIQRVKKAFELLFNEKYNFNYDEEFKFDVFIDSYLTNSRILSSAKTFHESLKNLEEKKHLLSKKDLEQLDKANNKHGEELKNGGQLISDIEKIRNSSKNNKERVIEFTDLLEAFLKKTGIALSNSTNDSIDSIVTIL